MCIRDRFTIDPRPYAAEVDRAAAALTAAKARASYTATELARGQRLLTDNAIARRDFEEKQNAAREAAANPVSYTHLDVYKRQA